MTLVSIPYEQTGRRRQKQRTRDALVEAARELLAEGADPTVEDAAVAAGVSRTTAYRYFPSRGQLLAAAYPEVDRESLLPDDPPADVAERLDLVAEAAVRIVVDWEPQLRAGLRVALEPGRVASGSPLRRGRAIGWYVDALAPLAAARPDVDVHRLALAIRSATGIESFVWLVDVAGLAREEAAASMRWTARALLKAVLDGDRPPGARAGETVGGRH